MTPELLRFVEEHPEVQAALQRWMTSGHPEVPTILTCQACQHHFALDLEPRSTTCPRCGTGPQVLS